MQYCSIHGITGVMGFRGQRATAPEPGARAARRYQQPVDGMARLPWQAEASRAAPVENGVFAGHSRAVPGKAQGATRQPPAPHTGHAPIPCPASTRWATAICSDGVAMFADAAYWPPP